MTRSFRNSTPCGSPAVGLQTPSDVAVIRRNTWPSRRDPEWTRRLGVRPRCACMHHGSGPDGSTEYKSAARYRAAGEHAQEVVSMSPTTKKAHPALKPAAGLAIVKGYVASRW